MAQETLHKWTDQQLQFIRFVGRGQCDTEGNQYTMEEFAKILGVHRTTLYDWRAIPGFTTAVFDFALLENAKYLPQLLKAQIAAAGKKGKGGDTQAFLAIMRQYELLKADKVDTKNETVGELKVTFY